MKKTVRLLSVLVAIAVLCSVLVVLGACGQKEYTVTYHDLLGNEMGKEVVKAVSNSAQKMVDEVRIQFKTIAGLREGRSKPNYKKCIEIATN